MTFLSLGATLTAVAPIFLHSWLVILGCDDDSKSGYWIRTTQAKTSKAALRGGCVVFASLALCCVSYFSRWMCLRKAFFHNCYCLHILESPRALRGASFCFERKSTLYTRRFDTSSNFSFIWEKGKLSSQLDGFGSSPTKEFSSKYKNPICLLYILHSQPVPSLPSIGVSLRNSPFPTRPVCYPHPFHEGSKHALCSSQPDNCSCHPSSLQSVWNKCPRQKHVELAFNGA